MTAREAGEAAGALAGLEVGVAGHLARLETKIDILITHQEKRGVDHESRLRTLETWRARATGMALGAGAGGGGAVGALITFLTRGAA